MNTNLGVKFVRRVSTRTLNCRNIRMVIQVRNLFSVIFVVWHTGTATGSPFIRKSMIQITNPLKRHISVKFAIRHIQENRCWCRMWNHTRERASAPVPSVGRQCQARTTWRSMYEPIRVRSPMCVMCVARHLFPRSTWRSTNELTQGNGHTAVSNVANHSHSSHL